MSEALIEDLEALVGDRLRSVAETGAEGYDVLYVREDVQQQYTGEEVMRIHRDVVLDGVRKGHLEDMFNAGEFHASAYVFEESVLFYFPRDEGSGLVVTVDSDCDLPIGPFMHRCKEAL